MAAFVPKFENDLFISYAHEDDKRWVQAFEDELRDEVSRRLGHGDFGLAGHRAASAPVKTGRPRFRRASKESAAFVAIVSPRYQNSQWCARERNEFQASVQGRAVRDQRPLLQGGQDAMA